MKKNFNFFLTLYIIGSSTFLFSQEARPIDSIPLSEQYIIFEGDTLLIKLDEVLLFKKLKYSKFYLSNS